MSDQFTPPRPDQWQGPGQQTQGGFTPPPVSSWQGIAPQPSLFDRVTKPINDFTDGAIGNLNKTALGAYDLARKIPGVDKVLPEPPQSFRQTATAVPNSTMGHIGAGAEQVGEFLAPAGIIGKGAKAVEAATAGIKGGKLIGAGARALMEGTGAGAVRGLQTGGDADAMRNAALMGGGASAAFSGAGAIGSRLLKDPQSVAARLYQSALKPAPSMDVADKDAMIREGLSSNIPLSRGGLDKTRKLIKGIDQQVGDRAAQGALQGDTISSQAVADATNPTRQRFSSGVTPRKDVADIDAAKREFLEVHGGVKPAIPPTPSSILGPNGQPVMSPGRPAVPPQPIPVDRALEIARATKPKAFGELTGASNETEKALKYGIKDQIYSLYPGLRDLGQKEKRFIDLDGEIERFIGREDNKTVVSAAAPIAGMASNMLIPGSGIPVAALKLIDKFPGLSSRIAIALNKVQPATAATAGRVGARVAAPVGNAVASPARVQMPSMSPAFAGQQPPPPQPQDQQSLGARNMPPLPDPLQIRRAQ